MSGLHQNLNLSQLPQCLSRLIPYVNLTHILLFCSRYIFIFPLVQKVLMNLATQQVVFLFRVKDREQSVLK